MPCVSPETRDADARRLVAETRERHDGSLGMAGRHEHIDVAHRPQPQVARIEASERASLEDEYAETGGDEGFDDAPSGAELLLVLRAALLVSVAQRGELDVRETRLAKIP